MTLTEQYDHYVAVLSLAVEAAGECIPGDEVSGTAIHAALGYVASVMALASSDPDQMMADFLVNVARAFEGMRAEQPNMPF